MRTVSIQELEAHTADLISEVEAGQRLTLVRGGKAIADIVPAEHKAIDPPNEHDEALERFRAFMQKGLDLGGFKITDRDALYDRD